VCVVRLCEQGRLPPFTAWAQRRRRRGPTVDEDEDIIVYEGALLFKEARAVAAVAVVPGKHQQGAVREKLTLPCGGRGEGTGTLC